MKIPIELTKAVAHAQLQAEGDSNDAEIEAWQRVGDLIRELASRPTQYDRGHAAGVKDTAAEVVEMVDRIEGLVEDGLTKQEMLDCLAVERATWAEHAGLTEGE